MQVIIFPDFYPFIYLIDDLRCNQEDFNYTTPARFIKEGNSAVTGGKRQPFAGGLKIAPRLAGDEASMIKIVLLSLYLIKWRSPGVFSKHSHCRKTAVWWQTYLQWISVFKTFFCFVAAYAMKSAPVRAAIYVLHNRSTVYRFVFVISASHFRLDDPWSVLWIKRGTKL